MKFVAGADGAAGAVFRDTGNRGDWVNNTGKTRTTEKICFQAHHSSSSSLSVDRRPVRILNSQSGQNKDRSSTLTRWVK